MNTPQHTPDQHSDTVGGSTASRVIGCPKSVSEIKALPPSEPRTTPHAERGTALHDAIAHILLNDTDVDAVAGMGFNDHTMEGELLDALTDALDAFDGLLDELADEGEFQFDVETQVQVPGIPNAWGTSDIIGRNDKRTIIVDWKFGNTPVSAKGEPIGEVEGENIYGGNPQLMFYARGAKHTKPEMFEDDPDWPVRLVIIQPALTPGVSQFNTTVRELEAFRMKLAAAVAEALGDDPRRATGPWCRWAECKATCPLHVSNAGALAQRLQEVKADEELPEDQMMTEDDLAERYALLLALTDELEPVFKDIRNMAHQFAEDQLQYGPDDRVAIPGHVLADKFSNKRWKDEKKADAALQRLGLSVKERRVISLITPTQAIDKLKKKGVELDDKHYERAKTGTALKREGPGIELAGSTTEKIGQLAGKLLGKE